MVHFYARFSFIIGIVLGALLAVYFQSPVLKRNNTPNLYDSWFVKQKLIRKHIPWDQMRYLNQTFYTESQYLSDKVKVLCIILVQTPKNLIAAKDTWARGCSSISPIIIESRNKIMPRKQFKENSPWVLLCNSLNDINVNNFNWVLVLKDSSFVIMENFRYFVAPLNSQKGYYLGHAVRFWSTVYNHADAGYALSAGTIEAFQKNIGREKCMDNSYWNREDFYLGKYLAALNITPINTVDEEGLSTFHPYNWYNVFYPGENYYKTSVFPVKCCSKRSISFQATESVKMYMFQYLFYKLQIFMDGNRGNRPNRDLIGDDKVWKQVLKELNLHESISSEQYFKLWVNLTYDPNSFMEHMKKDELFL